MATERVPHPAFVADSEIGKNKKLPQEKRQTSRKAIVAGRTPCGRELFHLSADKAQGGIFRAQDSKSRRLCEAGEMACKEHGIDRKTQSRPCAGTP